MALAWLESFTKPIATLLEPMATRIGLWFGRRKPHIYVHPNLSQAVWGLAWQGQRTPDNEMMQVVFWADINHDDPVQSIVVTDAYPEGTRPQIELTDRFAIPPNSIIHQQIGVFVLPIKGERGRPWTSRLILVDQFRRKYKTQKITFRWAGGPVQTQ